MPTPADADGTDQVLSLYKNICFPDGQTDRKANSEEQRLLLIFLETAERMCQNQHTILLREVDGSDII